MGGLLSELKHRNVLRVAAAYAVLSWLLLQVADIILPAFSVPDWTFRLLVLVLALGFVPVLIFSWAYELTPEGLKRESEIDRSRSITKLTGRRLDLITIGILVLVLAVIFVDRMLPEGSVEEVADSGRHEYSIAVLAFEDLSDTRDQEYFSDGLAEELLNKLAKLEGFRVAGRTSSFAFKDRPDDLRVIGEKLNVATILEGSVRKAGDQLRITAQLINVADGYHLWSETYDRRLDNVFAIQDEIAQSVVTALQVTITGQSKATRLEPTAPADTQAYELYLKARHLWAQRRPDTLREAQALLEQAIEIDPGYAPAYAGLATTLQLQVYNTAADATVVNPRAEAAIRRALALDPGNSDALASLGLLREFEGRIEDARKSYEEAIAHNPNNALAHRWLGSTYIFADPGKYLSLAQKAYSIDPLDPTMLFHVSRALSYFGRYEDAFSVARELQSMDTSGGRGYELVGNIRLKTGHQDTALKAYYRAYLTDPDGAEAFGYIPWILMNLSELELADAWVKELKKLTPERGYVLIQRADLAINRGRPELAVRILADAADRNENPWFDRLWGRFYMLSGDFANARIALERGLLDPSQEIPQFDSDKWPSTIDYAYVLQRTGAAEHAAKLIAETMALLEAQLVAGVVSVFRDFNLQANMAQLHALNGNAQQAVAALRRAAQQGGLHCLWCLRKLPQFDNLHDNADFISLIAEQEAKLAAQRQRLADEGMLLTPEQVLALENFSYDPFVD